MSYTVADVTTTVNGTDPVNITLPMIEGNCTVSVKLSKDGKENDVEATYTLSAPQPGEITVTLDGNPFTNGTTVGPRVEVTISSENATKLVYDIGDGHAVEFTGSTRAVTLPGLSGNYVLTVTAYRETENLTGDITTSINYTVDAPKPGEIEFTPVSGSTVDAGSTVSFTSANADRFIYSLNGVAGSAAGPTGTVTLPSQAGTATLDVTAYRGDESTNKSATYTINAPKPGAIVVNPEGGNVNDGQNITIESANAQTLTYEFVLEGAERGEGTTVDGPRTVITAPETAGTYNLYVTAKLGEEEVSLPQPLTFVVEVLTLGDIAFNPPCAEGETIEVGPGSTVSFTSENATSLSYTINGADEKITEGNSGTYLLPSTAGVTTIAVTAHRGSQQLSATATYKVVLPEMGEVTFNPVSGSELGSGESVTVSATNANKYVYWFVGGDGNATEKQTVENTTISIPFTAVGEWTLKVEAYRGDEYVEGTAYYKVTPPKSGPISFNPQPGTVKPGTTITVTSAEATKIEYTIYNGEEVVETNTVENNHIALVTLPETDGVYDLKIIAYRDEQPRETTVTYTVETPTQPGEITIDPAGGVVEPGRAITITCTRADRVKARINGGSYIVADGTSLTFNLPTDPGIYKVLAVAELGNETNSVDTEFIIKDTSVTGGDFILLDDIQTLDTGMKIVIADPEHDPQYIMCAPGADQTIFPQATATITNGVVVRQSTGMVLPVEKTASGNWYIGDANGYLYCAEDGTLSYSTENKSEFFIGINSVTKSATIRTVSAPENLILYHTTVDDGAGFACFSTGGSGRNIPSIYYQYTSEPQEPVFNPLSGVLREAGETIFVTAIGASYMDWEYKTLYGEEIDHGTVYGNTLELDIVQSGDVIVTAYNPNGFKYNSATYYISDDPSLDFDGLDPEDYTSFAYWRQYSFGPDDQEINRIWDYTGKEPITNGIYYLCASRKSESDPGTIRSYAYTKSQLILPETGITSIKATFDQIVNQLDQLEEQGYKFIIREYQDIYAEDPQGTCEQGWTFYNPFNTNGTTLYSNSAHAMRKADGDTETGGDTETDSKDPVNERVTIDLTAYKGKRVQVGFLYNTIEKDGTILDAPWYVQNLEIRHYIKNSIDDVINDADVDAEAPVEYYNLRGMRVSGENLAPGFYIRRQGTKATKILIK